MHFGQHFKASGNNSFAQIAHIFGNFFDFSSEIILGTFIDIWRLFTGHTVTANKKITISRTQEQARKGNLPNLASFGQFCATMYSCFWSPCFRI